MQYSHLNWKLVLIDLPHWIQNRSRSPRLNEQTAPSDLHYYPVFCLLVHFQHRLQAKASLLLTKVWTMFVSFQNSLLLLLICESDCCSVSVFITPPISNVIKKCGYRSNRTKNANSDSRQTNLHKRVSSHKQKRNLHFYQILSVCVTDMQKERNIPKETLECAFYEIGLA